ncbi:hypothetical protein FE257_004008 [Aspergillus nanangensis]|uniref:Uncharacterized protein n=1 Tax=Aspergillus nanangensis TaxID=2582783 RepID=A0AAD4CRS4_ASPNN|nr:hypothetical protein FE257_004008 [Aspergillus nanangensis]
MTNAHLVKEVTPCPDILLKAGKQVGTTQDKYNEEREKRLRSGARSEYLDLYSLERFRHFKSDPWAEQEAHEPYGAPRPDNGSHCEILIIGAGWSGLVTAVRLLQAGFRLEDMRIVDFAAGFGGTWYWNRYPGLCCDVESYIYMPLLEETGYTPTRKYTSGNELREHANRIAAKWKLDRIAWFQNRVTSLAWDDGSQEWATTLVPQLKQGEGAPITVRSRFAVLATGLLFIPHIPQIPGIEKFKGACFHPARWDYQTTGGSAENPEMVNLKDKRVGIIGTGATAVQVVPNLAAWSKHLHVFQRTPSAVDRRDNESTDVKWARTAFSTPGWQKERQRNFHSFVTNAPDKPINDMVSDGWTHMPSYSAMTGTPGLDCTTPEAIQRHLEQLHIIDLPRQESIRRRVDELVSDPDVASKLKPWYPGWCKRPCFHDEYLQTFNQPHVTLVDTSNLGITEITEDGVVVGDEDHKLDVLVVSTGYRSLFSPSPAGRVSIEITGCNGLSFDKKWEEGVTTLHGMMSRGFPNLFWPGLVQAGAGPNFTACVDMFGDHVASIISHAADATRATESNGKDTRKYIFPFTVEPTAEGEEEWSQLVASQAGAFSSIPSCTPNYYNGQGTLGAGASPEEQKRLARMSLWAQGPDDFGRLLADWRAAGFKDLTIAICYLAGSAFYNFFLHPLRKYPGPKLWAISRIPYSFAYTSGKAHKKILELHQQYGDVVRIAPNELIFCYPESFIDIMGHRKRGEEENGKDPDFWKEDSITLTGSNGERHRRIRRVLSHAFSAQAMAEQEPLIKKYVNLLIDRLKTAAAGGIPQEMTGWYNWATFDIIGDLAYGDPFGCLETSSYHPWVKLIFKHIKGLAINNSVAKYPFANTLLKLLMPKEVARDIHVHHEFNKAKVAKRLAVTEQRLDFMQSMIKAREKNLMSHAEIVANSHLLIVGGSETTATVLSGATYLLATHRPVLEKMHQEVKAIFSNEEDISLLSVQSLDYMMAVLKEVMRLYPAVPSAIPRRAPPQGATIRGEYIPADTVLGIWPWPMFHHPNHFAEPEAFIPERWLGDPKYENDKRMVLQPFSVGARDCIGKNLAYAEMRLILARMIWNFDLELDPRSEGWLERNVLHFLWDKPQLYIRLIPRTTA